MVEDWRLVRPLRVVRGARVLRPERPLPPQGATRAPGQRDKRAVDHVLLGHALLPWRSARVSRRPCAAWCHKPRGPWKDER